MMIARQGGDPSITSDASRLPRAERRQLLVDWNEPAADYAVDRPVTALIDEWVETTPDAAAVAFDGRQLTYRELAGRASRVAAWLRRNGAGPEVLIGIQIERSIEMLIAVLAVWKAGAAYVPLDPSYPEDRLRHMLEDSAPAVLLTQGPPAAHFAGVPAVDLADPAPWAHRPRFT